MLHFGPLRNLGKNVKLCGFFLVFFLGIQLHQSPNLSKPAPLGLSYLCFVQPVAYILKPGNRGKVLLQFWKSCRESAASGRNLILLSSSKQLFGLTGSISGIHYLKAQNLLLSFRIYIQMQFYHHLKINEQFPNHSSQTLFCLKMLVPWLARFFHPLLLLRFQRPNRYNDLYS